MSNAKLCISICSQTAEDLFEKIRIAEDAADIVEVRFDCLSPGEVPQVLANLPEIRANYLFTYRPSEQGGKRVLTLADRVKFWVAASKNLANTDYLVDHEFDINSGYSVPDERTIRSVHYFNGLPREVLINHDMIESLSGSILKIAATTTDAVDAIPLWDLLAEQVRNSERYVPIAMGEAGKWTRILGPAHGAFMTYASLDYGAETADGQISADELIEVFRIRQITRETKVYGIIAGNTTFSMSPYIHNASFREAGMDRVFIPFQVQDLAGFVRRMVRAETRELDLNFRGFSVTNPHKRTIIDQLDDIDATAERIGAVNTVVIENDRLIGFNTDVDGFIQPLIEQYGDLKGARVIVFGAGGAARACIYGLVAAGADVTVVARNEGSAHALVDEFGIRHKLPDEIGTRVIADIAINATPLGTKGENENATIATAEQLADVKLVYDLTYNPEETRLLSEARSAGCNNIGGMEMLIGQAVRQFELWTGETPSREIMRSAAMARLSR